MTAEAGSAATGAESTAACAGRTAGDAESTAGGGSDGGGLVVLKVGVLLRVGGGKICWSWKRCYW